MPERDDLWAEHAPIRSEVSARIGALGIAIENVGGVVDRVEMPLAAGILVVGTSLLVVPNALRTLGVVAVVVILMDGQDLPGGICHIDAQFARVINEPVIPPDAADDEWGHVGVEAASEREIVD